MADGKPVDVIKAEAGLRSRHDVVNALSVCHEIIPPSV